NRCALVLISPFAANAAATDIIVPSGVTIAPGQQMPFQITLAQPAAPGGVFITIASSDTSKITVSPGAVFVSEGGTAARPVQVTGISAGAASISASAANLKGDTETVLVGTAA